MSHPPSQPVISGIESLLLRAQSNPEARDAFYRAMLDAEVFAVVYAEEAITTEARNVIFASVTIQGEVWIPFATSQALFDDCFPGKEAIRLKGADLFTHASPKNFLMNPGTDWVKPFSPGEIDYILSLRPGAAGITDLKLDPGTQIALGEPKTYPTALVQKLRAFLPTLPEVRRAWIAQSLIHQDGATANLMMAVELEGDVDAVMPKLGAFVSPLIPPRTAFDMVLVNPSSADSGISRYFLIESQPFYVAGDPVPTAAPARKGFRRFFGL